MKEYRIKQVDTPMKDGTTITFYYPQVKVSVEETTSYLWWKRTETFEKWCNLKCGNIKENLVPDTDKPSALKEYICFTHIYDAIETIKKQKVIEKEKLIDTIRMFANIRDEDDELIKFHEIK